MKFFLKKQDPWVLYENMQGRGQNTIAHLYLLRLLSMHAHLLMSALDSCPHGDRTTIQPLTLMEIKTLLLDMLISV